MEANKITVIDTNLKTRMKGRNEVDKNGETGRPKLGGHDTSKKLFHPIACTITFLREAETGPLKDHPQNPGWARSEPNSGKDRTTVTTGA